MAKYVTAMASRWTGGAAGKTGRLYAADAGTSLARLTWSEITDDVMAGALHDMMPCRAKDTGVRIKAVRQFAEDGKIKEREIVEHHERLHRPMCQRSISCWTTTPAAQSGLFKT